MRSRLSHMPFAEINVTPLVDVMLVLLIIFMVTAPMMRQGIRVVLPKAVTGQEASGSNIVITLTKEHVVYFNKDAMTMKTLRQRLATVPRDTPIAIEADRYAYVDRLVALWDLCRELGLREIHIATLPE